MMILVPTSGEEAASEIAGYVVEIANALDASLEVLHILRDGETNDGGESYGRVFVEAAAGTGLKIKSHVASGDVVQAIVDVAQDHDATLIVMGASRGQLVEDWLSADVMGSCDVPVVVVPHCYRQ